MRTIREIQKAVRADMEDLITYRALPTPSGIEQLDPFIFLNHHGPQVYPPKCEGLPFGPHPHRGFETVTFILKGELLHQDSGGYKSIIGEDGIQWMTAGSGLIHAELSPDSFREKGGEIEILQLWINLPSKLKMTPPHYVGLQRDQIPSLTLDDGRVRVNLISGRWGENEAPIQSLTNVQMSSLYFKKGGSLRKSVPVDEALFFYVVKGKVSVNGGTAETHDLVEFGNDDDRVEIEAISDSVVLFGHARSNNEPIVAYGPFVMNTPEQINRAILDFRQGKFGVWK